MKYLVLVAMWVGLMSPMANAQSQDARDTNDAMTKFSQAVYQYINTQKPSHCIMPNSDLLGLLYENAGKSQSRDFYFWAPEGSALEVSLSQAEKNVFILNQVWPFYQHQLKVRFDDNHQVIKIEAILNSDSTTPLTVSCD